MDTIRIACGNRGVGTSPLFAAVEGGYMKDHGLDPELKFYEGHPRALPALVAGEAEFTNTVSPDVITIDLRDDADVVIVASAVSRSATYVTAPPGLTTRRFARSRPDVVLRYVRAYAQGVYRFRADGKFGIEVIRKYSGETDREILEASYLYFSQLMAGTMYPTPEGVTAAARMLHRLG